MNKNDERVLQLKKIIRKLKILTKEITKMKITAILNLKTSKHICLKKYINLPTIQVKNLIVIRE